MPVSHHLRQQKSFHRELGDRVCGIPCQNMHARLIQRVKKYEAHVLSFRRESTASAHLRSRSSDCTTLLCRYQSCVKQAKRRVGSPTADVWCINRMYHSMRSNLFTGVQLVPDSRQTLLCCGGTPIITKALKAIVFIQVVADTTDCKTCRIKEVQNWVTNLTK